MKPFCKSAAFLMGACILMTTFCLAQESDSKTDPKSDPKTDQAPKTVVAQQRPLVVYETLPGIVQSSDTHEIKTDFDEWDSLKVTFVLPQNTPVKKGDRLLEFDATELKRAIQSQKLEVDQKEMAAQLKKLAAEQAETTYKIDSGANERDMQAAREDDEYYKTVLRPDQLEDLEYSLRLSKYYVEYAQEELDQLMKMYNEDELTEESEQIVLKRSNGIWNGRNAI